MPDPTDAPQPRPAGPVTAARHAAAVDALPWDDRRAFEDVRRGRVAAIEPPVVRDASGRTVWDLTAYAFIEGDAPTTVHPSLWRLSELHRNHGLFEVADGVYQVRGYDAANMTVVLGERGYVVIDTLTCVETAEAALDLVRRHLGDRPVTAVLHTHGHLDHFGGVAGVVDEKDVRSGRVPLVAPAGFYEHAVSENVSAGPAMSRRSGFMFGPGLPKGARGHVMNGSCAAVATGRTSLIRPSHEIRRTGEELVLDGVRLVFQYVADTEAPAELTVHLPERRALCMAELISHHMHNLYTLRGAPVRDAAAWSAAIDEALNLFGDTADVMFLGHGWPVRGQDAIAELLGAHRDLYRYLHDETLRLANHGHTPDEIAELIELPESLDAYWANRGTYGATRHNVKAVYQRYLGWFDGNPAHLDPLPPAQAGRRYVELMGGIDAVLAHARTAHDTGEDRWAAELLAHALAADPGHRPARLLQADVLEQLGYRSEAAPWRNFYLVGAHELRHGAPAARPSGGPGLVSGMTTAMLLDYMAIRLNGPAAAGLRLRIGLDVTPEHLGGPTEDRLLIVVENGVLRHTPPPSLPEPTTTLRATRPALAALAHGTAHLDELLTDNTAEVIGDRTALDTLLGLLDTFTGTFEVVTPTGR
ncbi:MBL fold metallo-hydrolase [Streptomyces roseirectus]|uniref:MBL fold metallo-hydrolase n=1 Tax=Streptomyces roseirectus TaxID=2768066 RepID=A0A7H0IPH3_9ACTN|nr:alkyl sulfatase dimerization domain-containing protein [Streptomyces roseirectus]QNP74689.1 MBL fold metallo-hydrolase [Streptomyces roseirectus]